MADDKDYTSLLGRSSGSSWGDIAGAYLSGGRKKDNRARNVLLATLFFNAKEANMQNKVLKNLEELEKQKTLQLQNRAYAFEEGLKKQNQYDEVESRGAYDYYQDQAETAFYNKPENRKNKKLYDNEPDFIAAKEKWKQNWAEERHNQFLETYDTKAPRITTQAEFNKPINDYFSSRKEEITNPRNVSLVHKAFGFLPGAKERDKELADKTQASKIKYDKALERGTNLISVLPSLNVQELQALDRDKITIDDSNVRDLLVDDYGEDISSEIRSEVIKRFRNSNIKTYNSYLTISQSVIDNKFSINSQNTIKEASAKYDEMQEVTVKNPKMDIGKLNFIRKEMGALKATDDILEASQDFAELIADVNDLKGEERVKFIEEKMPQFVESSVNRLAGIRNPKELEDQFRLNHLIELTDSIASGQLKNEINRTTITRDLITSLPKEISSQISQDTLNFLNENKYEYSAYQEADSKITEELTLLQTEQVKRNRTDIFNSLWAYSLNKSSISSKSTEIPPAFKQKTINIDTPFR